ncbi:MAG: YARHG domain-containing protein [Bacteroidota bacterium]
MKRLFIFALLGIVLLGCKTEIKNSEAKIEIEKGTEIENSRTDEESQTQVSEESGNEDSKLDDPLLGFWVGYFEKDDEDYEKNIYVDEGYYWNRENKINISIDVVKDSLVFGHSVVAGNDRPFQGVIIQENETYLFRVREPGDDKYDGEFVFSIENGSLQGKWTAYHNIEIKNRKYNLEKKYFRYDPNISLEQSKEYVNWYEFVETNEEVEIDYDEFEEWISREFASATDLIYKINASNTVLTKNEVENLKKGDLTIIRNTIYARHGYSFKNRPLRVFFDAQSWYIPVHTNIKDDFTKLEINNIKLLLKYEKNASEYYDYFGRG